MSNYKQPKQHRIARTSLLALLAACGLVASSCRPSPEVISNTESASEGVTSSTPPFATKEPESYQAIRTTTFSESSSTPGSPPSETRTSSVVIARDGDKRREEYESGGTGPIVSLEIPFGRFVLLPASKLYADLSVGASVGLNRPPDQLSDVSPDSLLNETPAAARYQRLTTETVAGRTTTKYRVTTARSKDETAVTGETLVWIDEALDMPVKSELLYNEAGRSTRVTMELKDIRLQVDERLFVLPVDYRRVEASVIFELIRKGVKGAGPK